MLIGALVVAVRGLVERSPSPEDVLRYLAVGATLIIWIALIFRPLYA